ncbi:ATP-binding cassette transporter [Martiniozyma asiatica (nom. inval.)]|nr:ATP-binding cassette transporter [Martiniozyma asiatica]
MTENNIPVSVPMDEKQHTASSDDEYAEKAWQPTMEGFNSEMERVRSNGEENMMSRISTLSKRFSEMTATEMDMFAFSQNDFDLKRILQYISHSNEKKGIQSSQTDIVFEDFEVIGKNTSASVLKDVGDVLFAPITKLYQRLSHKKLIDLSKLPKKRQILRDVNGYATPGTMTLVLGRPGSGCSTFLKVISGETKTYIGYNGDISYCGVPSSEMFKNHIEQLVYNPELDVHFPYLTVEETLKFAVGCKTPNVRVDDFTRKEYIQNMKDLYEILFGLKHVEKTLVGNDFVRGVSGGQRKRVSIAEAMVTGGSLYCFDNATRGLDASTALEFAQALRTSTNVTKCTSLVTVYQASESIYELFDNVTVLYSGRQIYFGPIHEAVGYFEKMGYVKPSRQTTPEFLTSVTDPFARTAREGAKNLPETADEFAEYWRQSPEFARMKSKMQELKSSHNAVDSAIKFKEIHESVKQSGTGKNSMYTINYLEQLKLCSWRRFRNLYNNRAYTVTLVMAAFVQSLVVGSLYYNTTNETVGAFSRGGVIFFSCLYFAIMTLAETPVLFADKPILNKQHGYSMYHPSAELLSKQITQFPVRVFAITVFSIVLYFMTNLKREPGPYFQYWIVIILVVQCVSGLFTLLASFCPNVQAAMAICGICMMSMVVYSSYMIQRPSMYWWFKWFSYCNPVLYAFEAMITMQFKDLRMPCSPFALIPTGPSYSSVDPLLNQVCGFVGAADSKILYDGANDVNGDIYLSLAFQYTFSHAWRNFGLLFAFIIGYMVVNCIVVEVFNPIQSSSDQLLFIKGATLSADILKELNIESEDLEAGGEDLPGNLDTAQSASDQKLGSNDIFMWKNVDYVVPYAGEQRKLLDNVQGYVLPGTMTALMGESGAGKTTLLNVLSRRVDVGVVTGDMLINGHAVDDSFERRTGYVQQQDLHIAELTVRESLLFSARLRRPMSVPDEEKVAYVETVMKILRMEDYADCVAGEPGYGLNVEQRKKLSIATELVAKPSLLLFLDEPTSGLDSQSSWAIIQVLKDLAAAGQAILCTIHQPSSTLFEEFDRLLLLKKGGQTVYFGDIGENSRTMLDYFESKSGRKCTDAENPAEYILDVIGAGATASTTTDWYELWSNSSQCQLVSDEIENMIAETQHMTLDDNPELYEKFATPFTVQLYHVFQRTFLQFWRSLPYIMPKLFLMVIGGLLAGFSFWNVKHTVIGMQNVLFACFLTMIISAPLTNQIQGRAIASRELYEVRESKSNTFHWSCLLFSQYVCEIPFSILFSTIYFICWYFPIQLDNEASRAGTWWLTYCIFFQLYYPSLALMIVYPSPDLETANVLLGLCFSFIISFCGVVQRPSLMPGFWKFMWRASPMTYFIGSQVGILLHDRPVVCNSEEYNYLQPPTGQTCGEYLAAYFETASGYVNNPNDTSDCAVCQYKVGDEYLSSIGVYWDDRWRNIGLFCAYIAFNLFLMCLLYHVLRVKRINPANGIKNLISKFKKN